MPFTDSERNQICTQRTNPTAGILYYFRENHRKQHQIKYKNQYFKTANPTERISSVKIIKPCTVKI